MSIIVKNSQLTNETIQSLNSLIELDIKASAAFRLTRIIKEVSSIVEDKLKMEKKILEKWMEKDENGDPVTPKDDQGALIQGAVNITNVDAFSSEMQSLLDVVNEIPYEKIKFEDLNLQTAKVKDLLSLEFIFE